MSKTESTITSFTATRTAVNPEHKGTKAAAHYALEIGAGETRNAAARG